MGFSSQNTVPPTSEELKEDTFVPSTEEKSPLADLCFRYPLRKYQKEILELTQLKLERGERQLHIVAPPGAGKTIIGLQLVSQLQHNSLIISPTTTIQSQWAQKLEHFLPIEGTSQDIQEIIGTDEHKPLKPITLLTYQVLSTPSREQEYLEKLAHEGWVNELVSSGNSKGDAELRVLDLLQNNKNAHGKEMSRHITRLRRKLAEVMDVNEVLHPNAIDLIQFLRRQKFKLIIFDECHHLTDYWAAIMSHVIKQLDNPIVVGLTGTPPEGKSAKQENRYLSLVGDIDYQVPTPALVREGGLAPFQDLVLFTTPTEHEEKFLAEQHDSFHELLDELVKTEPSLLGGWITERIVQTSKKGWGAFASNNPELSAAMCRYVWTHGTPTSFNMVFADHLRQPPFIEDWMLLLEDFTLNYLKVSASTDNHALYERIRHAVSKLGYGLTERGLRKQASPVDRVLAFSRNKGRAVADILSVEYKSLEDRLRAVVVTDFEKMSAIATKQAKGVLSEESGGAIAVLRELLASEISNFINPCLVTGSLILVDKRIAEAFLEGMQECVEEQELSIDLSLRDMDNELFAEIVSNSSDWEARLYVGMATRMLERGITKTLIGTRGLFGEGWDCQALNTLIDLTTTTTPMSVKQLRGRSIRIDTSDPLGARKVANNWDVVCIAPHLEKGLNDYQRFARKHEGYFGICDDGQIECGVGHVHPSFSELTPADVFASLEDFNQEMRMRALAREGIYELWKVGQPYGNKTLGCIEISRLRKQALTPPHIRKNVPYKEHAKIMQANLNGVWLDHLALGGMLTGAMTIAFSGMTLPLYGAALPLVASAIFAGKKYSGLYKKLKNEICQTNTQESAINDLAFALLSALQKTKFLPHHISKESIKISRRSDGSLRVFLDGAADEHAALYMKCLRELLEPVGKQPYLIPKYEYTAAGEDGEDKFFKNYLRGRAESRIGNYHPVPSLLARSERGREAFQAAWNKYVSPGFIVATETNPELVNRYFGMAPSLAQRLLWE
ncbi:MAG: DEAD/DEAH box helicase family protein [Candidatus Obscuribacterales bacterium]|nr:DEAD/DEAH box helicase family protein [Candidatus Obscuribacterales bacterium]